MARRGSVITKAVVEQEIYFEHESYFKRFIQQLDYYEEPYKIVSKTYTNGYLVVVIRKRYGQYPFLGDIDPSTLSTEEREKRDLERGVTRDDDGILFITDHEKYSEWESAALQKSKY